MAALTVLGVRRRGGRRYQLTIACRGNHMTFQHGELCKESEKIGYRGPFEGQDRVFIRKHWGKGENPSKVPMDPQVSSREPGRCRCREKRIGFQESF